MSIPSNVPRLPLDQIKNQDFENSGTNLGSRESSSPSSVRSVDSRTQSASQKAILSLVESSSVSTVAIKPPPYLRANKVINIKKLLTTADKTDNPQALGYKLLEKLLKPSLKMPHMVINILKRCPDEGSRHFQIRSLVHPCLTRFPDTANRMKILSIAERLIDDSSASGINVETAISELKNLMNDKP